MNNYQKLPQRKFQLLSALMVIAGLWLITANLILPVAEAQSPNLALNKPVTCSSIENAGTACANAVDGNTGTRWASAFSDPQWIRVDLGATNTIGRVVLRWEAAYGKSYQIQTSNDASTWTTIYSTTTGDGGVDDLTGLSGSARYVRMFGTVRATQYGYSLWEFEVYGGATPTRTPTLVSTECDTPSCITPPGCGTTVVVTSTPTKTPSPTASATPSATPTKTPTATNTACGPIFITATPTPGTPTSTKTPTVTSCPLPTQEPLRVEPVTSPTIELSQVVIVYIGRGEAVTVTTESGVFAVTGTFNAFTTPALVNVSLLPNTTHHLSVQARVSQMGCYPSYTLSTTVDRNGAPLVIVQQPSTPTPTPTPTLPPGLPDLVVQGMSISGNQSCFGPGFQLGVWVGIANTGTGNAGAFVVNVNGATQTVSAGLPAGQSTSLFFPGYNSGTPNTATVDSTNLVTESNESNNTLSQQLPVPTAPPPCTPTPTPTPTNTSPSPLPDLVVTSVKGGREMSGSCATNLNLGINVTVQNSGSANAGTFLVEVNNNTGARKTVSGLVAGQSTTVWFNLSPQPITNTATVDVTNLVLESNESNNTLTVVGSPGTVTPTGTPPVTCTPTPSPTPTFTNTPTPTKTNTPLPVVNIALNKPVVCSSVENAGTPCAAAVDGNTGTRWASAFSDPQWIRVDFGATMSIARVVLRWEAAYGKSYQIQTSNDLTNWTTIYTTTTGDGGVDDITVSGSGRYIRMNGTVRATQYGYSLWELEAYN